MRSFTKIKPSRKFLNLQYQSYTIQSYLSLGTSWLISGTKLSAKELILYAKIFRDCNGQQGNEK